LAAPSGGSGPLGGSLSRSAGVAAGRCRELSAELVSPDGAGLPQGLGLAGGGSGSLGGLLSQPAGITAGGRGELGRGVVSPDGGGLPEALGVHGGEFGRGLKVAPAAAETSLSSAQRKARVGQGGALDAAPSAGEGRRVRRAWVVAGVLVVVAVGSAAFAVTGG